MDDSICKQLRKSYRCAEQQITILQDTMLECHKLLESLGNLAEQLQSCQRVAKDHKDVLLVSSFCDLTGRLQIKLIQSMEGILVKLQAHM